MTTQELTYVVQKTFKLSEEAQRLIQLLSQKYGINQTAVLEVILRNTAKAEGIPVQ